MVDIKILNENADSAGGRWDDTDAIAFTLYKNDIYISPSSTHGNIRWNNKFDGDTEYDGRIWVDSKVISFWEYPEADNKLRDILEKLNVIIDRFNKKKFNINTHTDIYNTYLIEIPIGQNNMMADKEDEIRFYVKIPCKKYIDYLPKSLSIKPIPHVLTPTEKEKHAVDKFIGVGSDKPRYANMTATQRQQLKTTSENIYDGVDNKYHKKYTIIKESPDTIQNDNGLIIADWSDTDSITFGMYHNKMYALRMRNHILLQKIMADNGDADHFVGKSAEAARKFFDTCGRIWFEKKYISFWNYPSDNTELRDVCYKLREFAKTHLNVDTGDIYDTYQIEVYLDNGIIRHDINGIDNYDLDDAIQSTLIPCKEYERSVSPDLSTPHRKPTGTSGIGSDKPNYAGLTYTQRKQLKTTSEEKEMDLNTISEKRLREIIKEEDDKIREIPSSNISMNDISDLDLQTGAISTFYNNFDDVLREVGLEKDLKAIYDLIEDETHGGYWDLEELESKFKKENNVQKLQFVQKKMKETRLKAIKLLMRLKYDINDAFDNKKHEIEVAIDNLINRGK